MVRRRALRGIPTMGACGADVKASATGGPRRARWPPGLPYSVVTCPANETAARGRTAHRSLTTLREASPVSALIRTKYTPAVTRFPAESVPSHRTTCRPA